MVSRRGWGGRVGGVRGEGEEGVLKGRQEQCECFANPPKELTGALHSSLTAFVHVTPLHYPLALTPCPTPPPPCTRSFLSTIKTH